MLPDVEGCLLLLGALGRQWVKDACKDPAELETLATWLDMTPHDLQTRIDGQGSAAPGRVVRYCENCGRELPLLRGPGRRSLWCSDRCRHRR